MRWGAERKVPGANTVIDALAPLFEQSNPTPPTPSANRSGNGNAPA